MLLLLILLQVLKMLRWSKRVGVALQTRCTSDSATECVCLFHEPWQLFPEPCHLFLEPCHLFPEPCYLFPEPCQLFPVWLVGDLRRCKKDRNPPHRPHPAPLWAPPYASSQTETTWGGGPPWGSPSPPLPCPTHAPPKKQSSSVLFVQTQSLLVVVCGIVIRIVIRLVNNTSIAIASPYACGQ
jgi:hypothetical protein